MKINLTLLLLAFNLFASAQTADIVYSQKFYKEHFYDQVKTLGDPGSGQTSQYIGLSGSAPLMISAKFSYIAISSFSILVPRKITIADTLSGKITGFNFYLPAIGIDLFRKSEKVDLLINAGINMGRLRMYKNEQIRQKNPYFSPQIAIAPRFLLGKMALSLNVGYEYDISKTGWRRTMLSKRETKINVDNFRQTGIMASFSIGYVLE